MVRVTPEEGSIANSRPVLLWTATSMLCGTSTIPLRLNTLPPSVVTRSPVSGSVVADVFGGPGGRRLPRGLGGACRRTG